ncbi:hypothetical protein PoB_004677700 [Plakobranchus ocellatus]|uniref:Uncharacterized protein n=1 Tax=Plakobranchus ocellatus TaxID=259542 RepID=A0AAV4BLR9_9GAST|nr:hypothetical protein PoB_004677700 [Plakobranchus ocellatus]
MDNAYVHCGQQATPKKVLLVQAERCGCQYQSLSKTRCSVTDDNKDIGDDEYDDNDDDDDISSNALVWKLNNLLIFCRSSIFESQSVEK